MVFVVFLPKLGEELGLFHLIIRAQISMGGHLNLDGGTLNLDGETLTLDGGTRPPYNLSPGSSSGSLFVTKV